MKKDLCNETKQVENIHKLNKILEKIIHRKIWPPFIHLQFILCLTQKQVNQNIAFPIITSTKGELLFLISRCLRKYLSYLFVIKKQLLQVSNVQTSESTFKFQHLTETKYKKILKKKNICSMIFRTCFQWSIRLKSIVVVIFSYQGGISQQVFCVRVDAHHLYHLSVLHCSFDGPTSWIFVHRVDRTLTNG